jgi:hypothetical protein
MLIFYILKKTALINVAYFSRACYSTSLQEPLFSIAIVTAMGEVLVFAMLLFLKVVPVLN